MGNQKRIRKRILIITAAIIAALIVLVFGMNAYVAQSSEKAITGTDSGSGVGQAAVDDCKSIDPQCILVLGCGVWANNQPSPMLKDRMDTAIELYRQGAAPKLLLSGDNSVKEYSEPDCMLEYALKQGVPAEDIFLDFAGFSTYDSVYRAKAIFRAERLIAVTQKYHMFRTLKNCSMLGIAAKGVASNQRKYKGRFYREAREVLARDKDLIKGILKPEPTFLGDEIPIEGDGTVTHANSPNKKTTFNVTVINEVCDADIWVLPQTEENLKTTVWGKATVGGLRKGEKGTAAVNVINETTAADGKAAESGNATADGKAAESGTGNDGAYIIRIIDSEHSFYAANDIVLAEGYTIQFKTDGESQDAVIEILNEDGNLVGSQAVFEGALGAN